MTFERMTAEEYRKEFIDKPKSYNKFRNKWVEWHGIWRGKPVTLKFQSIKERDVGILNMFREKKGEIRGLSMQKRFELIPATESEKSICYDADFHYYECKTDRYVVEDVKSEATKKIRNYINKRKMFKIKYPHIDFREV